MIYRQDPQTGHWLLLGGLGVNLDADGGFSIEIGNSAAAFAFLLK
jgi:hypothetical protein